MATKNVVCVNQKCKAKFTVIADKKPIDLAQIEEEEKPVIIFERCPHCKTLNRVKL
jgi:hypothetical protein